jgi:hypothetical protein
MRAKFMRLHYSSLTSKTVKKRYILLSEPSSLDNDNDDGDDRGQYREIYSESFNKV